MQKPRRRARSTSFVEIYTNNSNILIPHAPFIIPDVILPYPWQIKSLRRYHVISCISHRLPSRVAFTVLNKERREKSRKEGKKFSGQFTRQRSGSVVSHLDNTLRTTRSRKAHTHTHTHTHIHSWEKERTIFEGSVKKGKEEKREEKKRKERRREKRGREGWRYRGRD